MVGNNFGGAFTSTTLLPLISFHSIYDEDFAVVKNCIINYRNKNVFDYEAISKMSYFELLGKIYHRKEKNPLYCIMKNDKYKDLLDRVYDEFINDHEEEILKYAVSTDIINMILEFKRSGGEVKPSILYYTQPQLDLLNKDERLFNIEKISLRQVLENNMFSHYYVKYIDEIEPFVNNVERGFYISSAGLNLNGTNDDILIDNDKIIELMSKRLSISMYDMYKPELIGDYNS